LEAPLVRADCSTIPSIVHGLGDRRHGARSLGDRLSSASTASWQVVDRTPETRASVDREQNQAIREWAHQQTLKLSEHGRIPSNVLEAYRASH
jgi:Lsr2